MAAIFRSIMVPLDRSPLAEAALPLAIAIANPCRSKLRLVLVHRPAPLLGEEVGGRSLASLELALRKEERAYVRGVRAKIEPRFKGTVAAVTLGGAVGPSLVRYVRELGVDLVVMATHGRGGIQRAWLGSVADQLVRTLEIPVLLVRGQPGPAAGEAAAGPILVPLDGSPLAEQVLGPAGALARLWGAELALVQVVQPVTIVDDPALPLPTAYDEGLTQELRRQAQDYLDGLAGRLKEQEIRATAQACIGWRPVQTLLDLARPERVRLVAVATHGRGGLQRLALGSVADKLVRAAEVPVLVHRPRAAGRKRSGASGRTAR